MTASCLDGIGIICKENGSQNGHGDMHPQYLVPANETYKANLSFLAFSSDFPFHFVPESHLSRRKLRMRELLTKLEYPEEKLPDISSFPRDMISVQFAAGEIAVFAGDLWHAGGGSELADIRFFAHADCDPSMYHYPFETVYVGSNKAYPREANHVSFMYREKFSFDEEQLMRTSKDFFDRYCESYCHQEYVDFLKTKN